MFHVHPFFTGVVLVMMGLQNLLDHSRCTIRNPLDEDPPDNLPVARDAIGYLTEKPVKHPDRADENGDELVAEWSRNSDDHG